MKFKVRFQRLLGVAMFVTGTACLIWALVRGHGSAWSAAAVCFCTSGVCFTVQRKPPEEG